MYPLGPIHQGSADGLAQDPLDGLLSARFRRVLLSVVVATMFSYGVPEEMHMAEEGQDDEAMGEDMMRGQSASDSVSAAVVTTVAGTTMRGSTVSI
jgi:hypothetical protein